VYVTLAAPQTANLYHTVVHLACSKPGATTPNQAVANTWDFFKGKSVKTWSGTPLTYYGTPDGGFCTDTETLLSTHDGQCHSFATLLTDSLRANGLTDIRITRVLPALSQSMFGVNNIGFSSSPSFPANPDYKYSNPPDLDTSVSGIPGQNMSTPLAKLFVQHFIVRRGVGTEYYDPSYGIPTTTSASCSANVGAWQRDSDWLWRDAQGSGLEIRFIDNNPY
jgi:hypothetical protein